jgi:mono/diheme cytochrome c family protein
MQLQSRRNKKERGGIDMGAFKGAITMLGALLLVIVLNHGAAAQQSQKQGQKNELPEEKHLIESLDGRLLFRAYCASCHGQEGRGGGPAVSALKTPPPDLTGISQRNGGKFPSVLVGKIISGEEDSKAAHGSRQMPIWGPVFRQINWDQDLGNIRIHNVTTYIESLQRK